MAIYFTNKGTKYSGEKEEITNNFFKKNIHDQVMASLKLEDAEKDAADAALLTDFLKLIKQNETVSGIPGADFVNDFLQNGQIKGAIAKLHTVSRTTGRKGSNLEEALATIFGNLANYAFSKAGGTGSIKKISQVVGKDSTTSGYILLEEDVKELISSGLKDLTEDLVKEVVEKGNSQQTIYRLVARAGKTDVTVGNIGKFLDISVDTDPSLNLNKILSIINNANFSAKNYTGTTIHLGNANYFRAWSSVFFNANIPASPTDIVKMYNASRKSAILHHQHIRFVYELTGAGQLSISGAGGGLVKFLVVNNPKGGIQVFSTKKLIKDYINSSNLQRSTSLVISY